MKSSIYLSLGLLSAVVVWMLSGAFANVPHKQDAREEARKSVQTMKVAVTSSAAREVVRELVVQGELEPNRQVEIRARTASRVVSLPVEKGERVEAGALLIEMAEEDRMAKLKRAQAEVRSQEFEVAGARRLQDKGLQAESRVKASEAALAAARAEVELARLELEYIRIPAPFSGVLEERRVEIGSHVEEGDTVALVVDDSMLKAVGYVSQQSAGKLRLGQETTVRLLDGRQVTGRLTYIARVGDAETHSFRVEAEVDNTEGLLNAGISAELRIATAPEIAHFLSPAILSLGDSGQVGVKTVNEDGLVSFHSIGLVRTEADGVWVSGLPKQATIISQGQGFVNAGETVIPVPAS